MKKGIVFVVIALMVCSVFTVFADNMLETPMLPLGNLFSTIRLSSDVEGEAYTGDEISFITTIADVERTGVTSIVVEYTYTDGLVFNDDLRAIGLPLSWTVCDPEVDGNTVKVVLYNEDMSEPIHSNINFRFSFTVDALAGDFVGVEFKSVELVDKKGEVLSKVTTKYKNNRFTTLVALPEVDNIGASLRINNTPALRFGMVVSKDFGFSAFVPDDDYVYSADANIKFGMLIMEKSKYTGSELTVSTSGVTKKVFTEAYSENSTEIMYVYTITGITDYTKEYVFRPFIMYRQTDDGAYTYEYGIQKTRSARTVAQAELRSESDSKKIQLLKKFTEE